MPKTTTKISRRDAIKLLGAAAGASLLANLPTKWTKPELATGVLPAHAQTSVTLPTVDTVAVGAPLTSTFVEVAFVSPAPGRAPLPNFRFTGKVTSDGGSPLTANGFVWDVSSNPSPTLSSKLGIASPTLVPVGSFFYAQVYVTFVSPGDYYVRAYATNGVGTGYGGALAFSIST